MSFVNSANFHFLWTNKIELNWIMVGELSMMPCVYQIHHTTPPAVVGVRTVHICSVCVVAPSSGEFASSVLMIGHFGVKWAPCSYTSCALCYGTTHACTSASISEYAHQLQNTPNTIAWKIPSTVQQNKNWLPLNESLIIGAVSLYADFEQNQPHLVFCLRYMPPKKNL